MKRFFTTVFVISLFFLSPQLVQGFAVTPASVDLEGQRGESISSSFTLINTSNNEQTYYLDTIKFSPREDGGGPRFISPDEDISGLAEWINFENESIRIPPRSQAQVPFQISVPNDVRSGGYYAAALVSDAPADVVTQNGALIEAKTAVLVFFTVTGETEENAQLLDFTFDKKGTVANYAGGYQVRIQNQGNVHVSPEGRVTVKDMFGRILESEVFNPSAGKILPGTTRAFSGDLGSVNGNGFLDQLQAELASFVIGPVTVELDIYYGESKKTLKETRSLWVVPWRTLTLGSVVLFGAAVFIYTIRKRNRKSTKQEAL